ncbi:hypothetical protein [Mucilaginibacter psychrotolerans]|uniref:Uncharacterized protein n=1 Tax=Mucilaginibacter psychrotolerans TaxID=1524096 RepID=A0A4Y8SHT8_9SPHI|nr:hypothetical protein [Mucilaginibacter psychrotolerans]TFF38004.1 hypothetical protein E2R66_10495 [Mucilaginibacter psychrotolerans]
MKKLFFLLAPIIVLLSCTSNPTKKHTDTLTAAKPKPAKQRTNLLPVYQGVWVKSDYIEKIRRTKSVLASVDLVAGITGMQIDTATITGDSLMVTVGWDNQNPGSVAIRLKHGKRPGTLQFGDDELGYSVANGDTALLLYQVYNKQLFTTPYHKIANVDANKNVSDGINYVINKALIAGSYAVKGVTGKTSKVIFTPDGTVTGLAGFRKYFIENDLKPGPLKNMDLITFDEFSSKSAVYHYVFEDNTLKLYEAKPNTKATLIVLGKLKYTLTRQ